MAASSSLKSMTLCLTLVCLICSSILGVVYAVTYEPIAKANADILAEGVGKVLPQGVKISGEQTAELDGVTYSYYEATDGSGSVAAYAVKSTSIGFGGPLSLMVGVLPDGTIYNTSVLSHSETPGLGAKCTSDEAFMSQWRSLSPDKKLLVKKDGGDIDAITASTITSRAYTLAVANAKALALTLASGGGNAGTAGGADACASAPGCCSGDGQCCNNNAAGEGCCHE